MAQGTQGHLDSRLRLRIPRFRWLDHVHCFEQAQSTEDEGEAR